MTPGQSTIRLISSDAGAKHVTLYLVQNPGQCWRFNIGRVTIGSESGSDISLPGLRPYHAEIHIQEEGYVVYAIGQGRVLVNGRLVRQSSDLKSGALIRLGRYDFIFGVNSSD